MSITNAAADEEVGSSQVSHLNADAEPYIPLSDQYFQQGSRIQRSLFFTFSSGLPVNPIEIHQHFTQIYGDCVEFVYVHREEDRVPEFGRILFRTAEMTAWILGGRRVVKTFIGDKPMWLKKYVPRHRGF